MTDDPRERGGSPNAWDRLHLRPGFPPLYPSEAVVRFGVRHFGSPSPQRVLLDLGCGGGRHTAFLASLGHRVVALDYSIEGCAHTRAHLRTKGLEALVGCSAMQAICLPDESVDGAIAYGVLYYTDAVGYRAAVRELWRVLKPGGRLLVQTRATSDYRFGKGTHLEERTRVMPSDLRDEGGMTMHFIDRPAIADLFGAFSEVVVDSYYETLDGGTRSNSDWTITLVK